MKFLKEMRELNERDPKLFPSMMCWVAWGAILYVLAKGLVKGWM